MDLQSLYEMTPGERYIALHDSDEISGLRSIDLHNWDYVKVWIHHKSQTIILSKTGQGWVDDWDFFEMFSIGENRRRRLSARSVNDEITARLRLAQEDLISHCSFKYKDFGDAAEVLELLRERKFGHTRFLNDDPLIRICFISEKYDHLAHLGPNEWDTGK